MNGSVREEIAQRTNTLVLGKAGRVVGKPYGAFSLYVGTVF